MYVGTGTIMSRKIEGEFFVLHENIDHDYFVRVAEDQGWIKRKIHEGDGEREAFQEIWTTEDNANTINFVNDPITGTRYLWVRGSRLNEILFEICRSFPAYEPEELIQMVIEAEEHNKAVDALFRLAVAFPNFDPTVFQIFETYLTHSSPVMREATIQAIAYRFWSESIPLLERVVQEDSDENVRQFAQNILNYA